MTAMPINKNDREQDKFTENSAGETAVRTVTEGVIDGTFAITGLKTGKSLVIPLDATTWVEATTGLLGGLERTVLAIQNQSDNTNKVLWRYDIPSAGPTFSHGWRIEDGGFKSVVIQAGTGSKVYIKMLSGSGSALVEEISPT